MSGYVYLIGDKSSYKIGRSAECPKFANVIIMMDCANAAACEAALVAKFDATFTRGPSAWYTGDLKKMKEEFAKVVQTSQFAKSQIKLSTQQLTCFDTRVVTEADRTGPNADVINRSGASTLTTINEQILSNLTIKNNYKTVVISIVGNSRSGKSAFLNCIISRATDSNVLAFKSMSQKDSEGKDVTHGMNYYIITEDSAKINYMFIDVQGLGGEISTADPTVLMFAYYISDIMIINHRGRFESATLSVLMPIVTLVSKLQNKQTKPLLTVRIFDADDEYDDIMAEKNYNVVMKPRDDQYSGVRQCISDLFVITSPPIIYTKQPALKTRNDFDKGVFDAVLRDDTDELNFVRAATSVINLANSLKGSSDVDKYIKQIAASINSRSADINVGVFDTSSQVTKDDVSIWIYGSVFLKDGQKPIPSMVDPILKKSITISLGTETEWKDLVAPRIKLVEETYAAYQQRFGSAPKLIRDQGMEKLKEIIQPELDAAVVASDTLAYQICDNTYKSVMTSIYSWVLTDLEPATARINSHRSKVNSALRSCGANQRMIDCTIEESNSTFDALISTHESLVCARAKLEADKSSKIINDVKNYEYAKNLNGMLQSIKLNYEECVVELVNQFMAASDLKPAGVITRLANWFAGKPKKNVVARCYQVHSDNKLIEIKNKPEFDKELDVYQPKQLDLLSKARNELIQGFDKHKATFEAKRAENLSKYLANQTPRDLAERNKFYEEIRKHNAVRMIPYEPRHLAVPAYKYLTHVARIDIHKIYTVADFEKEVPIDVRNHYRAIADYEASNLKLEILGFMQDEMLISWYRHLIVNY